MRIRLVLHNRSIRWTFFFKVLRLGRIRSARAWNHVFDAYRAKGRLLALSRDLLLTEEGIRFVDARTSGDSLENTDFHDCFRALAQSGDVAAMLTCVDLMETVGASDRTRDYLSWFWGPIRRGGLTSAAEAILVLRNACKFSRPDYRVSAEELRDYAIRLLEDNETTRPEFGASYAQLDRLLATLRGDQRPGDEQTIAAVESILSNEARRDERRRST